MAFRVLIADSDRSLLDTYGAFLSRDGFDVVTACDGLECIRKLRAWRPDVMVLDLNIPWGGGTGVLDLMRHSDELPHVPTVVLTSRWNELSEDDALAYSLAESFDFKPLAPEQLARLVRRQIDDAQMPVNSGCT